MLHPRQAGAAGVYHMNPLTKKLESSLVSISAEATVHFLRVTAHLFVARISTPTPGLQVRPDSTPAMEQKGLERMFQKMERQTRKACNKSSTCPGPRAQEICLQSLGPQATCFSASGQSFSTSGILRLSNCHRNDTCLWLGGMGTSRALADKPSSSQDRQES